MHSQHGFFYFNMNYSLWPLRSWQDAYISVCTKLRASLWRRKHFSTFVTRTFQATRCSPSRGPLAMTKTNFSSQIQQASETFAVSQITQHWWITQCYTATHSEMWAKYDWKTAVQASEIFKCRSENTQCFHTDKNLVYTKLAQNIMTAGISHQSPMYKYCLHTDKSPVYTKHIQNIITAGVLHQASTDAKDKNKNASHHATGLPTMMVVRRELGSPTESLGTIFAFQSGLLVNEWVLFESSLQFAFVRTHVAWKQVLSMGSGDMFLQILWPKVGMCTDFALVIMLGCMQGHMSLQSKSMSKLLRTLVIPMNLANVDRQVNVTSSSALESSNAMSILACHQAMTDFHMALQLHTGFINAQITDMTHKHESFCRRTMLFTQDTSETQCRLKLLWNFGCALLLVPCLWREDITWSTHRQRNVFCRDGTRGPFPLGFTLTGENPAWQITADRHAILLFFMTGKHFSRKFAAHRSTLNWHSASSPIGLRFAFENMARKQHTLWHSFTVENPPRKQCWQGEFLDKHGHLPAQHRECHIQRQMVHVHLTIQLQLVTKQLWFRVRLLQHVFIPHTTVHVQAGLTPLIVYLLYITINQHADFANNTRNWFFFVRSQCNKLWPNNSQIDGNIEGQITGNCAPNIVSEKDSGVCVACSS